MTRSDVSVLIILISVMVLMPIGITIIPCGMFAWTSEVTCDAFLSSETYLQIFTIISISFIITVGVNFIFMRYFTIAKFIVFIQLLAILLFYSGWLIVGAFIFKVDRSCFSGAIGGLAMTSFGIDACVIVDTVIILVLCTKDTLEDVFDI